MKKKFLAFWASLLWGLVLLIKVWIPWMVKSCMRQKKLICDFNMIVADAWGAGAGAVTGLVLGSAAGPAGTVLGAVGGAVAMGMNGSAVAGLKELADGYYINDDILVNNIIVVTNLDVNNEHVIEEINKELNVKLGYE